MSWACALGSAGIAFAVAALGSPLIRRRARNRRRPGIVRAPDVDRCRRDYGQREIQTLRTSR